MKRVTTTPSHQQHLVKEKEKEENV